MDFKICSYLSFVLTLVLLFPFSAKTKYKQMNKNPNNGYLCFGVRQMFIIFFLLFLILLRKLWLESQGHVRIGGLFECRFYFVILN